MESVTAIILTKNEELNLPDCLNSIKEFCERIVVIDSGSDDKTVEIAKKAGADVYFHKFENYSKQFNWGIDNTNVKTKWTLRLDADERLTPKLCKELSNIIKNHDSDEVNGVTMDTWLYFMGKKIKHGGHIKRKLMLFKTGKGRIENMRMDEHTILSEGSSISAKERYIHYDFKDMTSWINKLNWYATREMQDYIENLNGKNNDIHKNDDKTISAIRRKKYGFYYKLPLFFRCWLLFIYIYVFKLGFLDGTIGFIYHWTYHRFYRSLVDAKILEYKKNPKPFEETGDLK